LIQAPKSKSGTPKRATAFSTKSGWFMFSLFSPVLGSADGKMFFLERRFVSQKTIRSKWALRDFDFSKAFCCCSFKLQTSVFHFLFAQAILKTL